MMMTFPDIVFLTPLVATLLRTSLAVMLLFAAWKHIKHVDLKSHTLTALEGIAALALILGAYTQIAAIGAFVLMIFWLAFPRVRPYSQSTIFLALVMALSLVIMGAGLFAMDMPL